MSPRVGDALGPPGVLVERGQLFDVVSGAALGEPGQIWCSTTGFEDLHQSSK